MEKEFIHIVEEYEASDYCGIGGARGIIGVYRNRKTANIIAEQTKKENGEYSGLIVCVMAIELQ